MTLELEVKKIEGIGQVFDEVLDEIADFIVSEATVNLIKNKSSDTGFLMRSADIERKRNVRKVIFRAEYADFIEYGTPPHYISGYALEDWVRRKLGIKSKRARSVAWAIAKKISREGTDAKPFLRPALDKARSKFERVI